MAQGVPEFGVWNDPNSEKFGFTNTFDVARRVRHDRSSMERIPNQQKIDTNPDLHKETNSGSGERTRNEKSPVGYDTGAKSSANLAEQIKTQQNQRPTGPIERRRHHLSPERHQKMVINQEYPKGRHERPRTGSTKNGVANLPPEARHRRRASSSSDSSRHELLSSREEEFATKETKQTYHKQKGPIAPEFGKWNVDPNCTQEYTIEFAAVRNHQEEQRVVETPNEVATQSYYIENPQQNNNGGTKTCCLDWLFPRVKTL